MPVLRDGTKAREREKTAMELTEQVVSGPGGVLDASITSARLHWTRSVQACLSRDVPTDHEAHSQRSSSCEEREREREAAEFSSGVEMTQLLWESIPEVEAEHGHDRVHAQALSEQTVARQEREGGGSSVVSEQLATTQLMERNENVVQGATMTKTTRRSPSSFDEHQSGPTAGENKSESARRRAFDKNSPMLQRRPQPRSVGWRDSGEQDLAFHHAGPKRSEQDAHNCEEANDPINVADSRSRRA